MHKIIKSEISNQILLQMRKSDQLTNNAGKLNHIVNQKRFMSPLDSSAQQKSCIEESEEQKISLVNKGKIKHDTMLLVGTADFREITIKFINHRPVDFSKLNIKHGLCKD